MIMSQFEWVPLWEAVGTVMDALLGQFLTVTILMVIVLAILLYVNPRSRMTNTR
jgi:hypothetical protein